MGIPNTVLKTVGPSVRYRHAFARLPRPPRKLMAFGAVFGFVFLGSALMSCVDPADALPEDQAQAEGQVDPLWGYPLTSKIDSLAEATLADGPVAALGIGVKRGEELLLAKGYGMADVEKAVPTKAETVYRIGSITKQFTAAAVMQLVEDGKIGLDDPMTRFLPEFPT